MGLAQAQSVPSVHPQAWLEDNARFVELATELWKASVAYHHYHDRHHKLYDAARLRHTRRPNAVRPAELLRLEEAESALRRWLGHCQPPVGSCRPSGSDVDRIVHLVKKSAKSGWAEGNDDGQVSSTLAPAF